MSLLRHMLIVCFVGLLICIVSATVSSSVWKCPTFYCRSPEGSIYCCGPDYSKPLHSGRCPPPPKVPCSITGERKNLKNCEIDEQCLPDQKCCLTGCPGFRSSQKRICVSALPIY